MSKLQRVFGEIQGRNVSRQRSLKRKLYSYKYNHAENEEEILLSLVCITTQNFLPRPIMQNGAEHNARIVLSICFNVK